MSAAGRSNGSRRSSLLRRGLIPLALVLAALLTGELGARVLGSRFTWRPLPPFGHDAVQMQWLERSERELAEGKPPPGYSQFDATLGWSALPGYVSPAKDIHINARGLRSLHEYPELPAPGVQRVIACGESFTFGEEVRDAESWAAQLEALAPAREVWNYGVGGYGTDQALLRVTREAHAPAEVLLVGLMLENIGRNVNRYRPLWYPGAQPAAKPRFVLGAAGLELVPLSFATRAEFTSAVRSNAVFERLAEHEHWSASPVPEWLLGSMLVRLIANERAYAARELAPLYADIEGEPFQTTLALLEAFRPVAARLGDARLLVLFFPMKSDLAAFVADGTRYWSTLAGALEARGISFLDLTDPLAAEARTTGVDALYLSSHFSPRANALVAAAIHARLAQAEPGAQPK